MIHGRSGKERTWKMPTGDPRWSYVLCVPTSSTPENVMDINDDTDSDDDGDDGNDGNDGNNIGGVTEVKKKVEAVLGYDDELEQLMELKIAIYTFGSCHAN